MHFPHILLLLLSLLYTPSSSQEPNDAKTMFQIRDQWNLGSNWTDPNVCSWSGVKCNKNGRVTEIVLEKRNITTAIPDAIGGLTSLTKLDLYDNDIPDSLPISFSNLVSLQYLDICRNSISGDFPIIITKLLSLEYIDLSDNILSGEIPPSIGDLVNLKTLILSGNSFTGVIPKSLSKLTKLVFLLFTNLPLLANDTLPDVCAMSSLDSLNFQKTNRVGEIPECLCDLKKLHYLILSDNNMDGVFPPCFSGHPELQDVEIWGNEFTGEISHLSLPSLVALDVSDNNFEGFLPDFKDMKNLSYLGVYDNKFTGGIPPFLAEIPALNQITAHRNSFTGRIPELCKNGQDIKELYFFSNKLEGGLASSFASCPHLSFFWVQENNLSGPIPDGPWPEIFSANFSTNGFTGKIPEALKNLDSSNFDNNPGLEK